MVPLWDGGFRMLKQKGKSYYFKGFGLVPDWEESPPYSKPNIDNFKK